MNKVIKAGLSLIVRSTAITRLSQQVVCALMLLLLPLLSWAADLTASVDRTEISKQQVVVLQLNFNGRMGFTSPDWDALETDFDIVRQNRSTNITTVNGDMETVTQWSLTLAPKRTGEITIPAFSYKGATSQPVVIKVSQAPVATQKDDQEFYFEREISSGPYYVQQQIVLTERLYYTVNHDNAVLSELVMENARVELLDKPKNSIEVINGRRIGVYHRRYAIFPEQSGELLVPAQTFRADIINRRDFFGRGRLASATSENSTVEILPIPNQYPTAPWIPAQQLTLSEEQDAATSSSWNLGEPITRTLTVRTTGLLANQIPAIPLLEVPNLRYYPEQVAQNNEVINSGVRSVVSQSIAIIPTEAGRFELPEIEIPWWNTLTQEVEIARIPSRMITIVDSNAAERVQPDDVASNNNESLTTDLNTSTKQPDINDNQAATNSPSDTLSIEERLLKLVRSDQSLVIYLLPLLLLSVLFNFIQIWQRRRRPATAGKRESDQLNKTTKNASIKQLQKELKNAILHQDNYDIRQAIVLWGRAFYGLSDEDSLVAIANRAQQPYIQQICRDLDAHDYGQKIAPVINRNQLWQSLQQEIESNQQQMQQSKSSKISYSSLYSTK